MQTPKRITIDTNPNRCNLSCIFCDTHSEVNKKNMAKRPDMSKELLISILDQALKIDSIKELIPTTMGEPLMYKYFSCFIDKIKGTNKKLNLTTNGTFHSKDIKGVKSWAEKLLPILSDIKISINSINPKINEYIMKGDDTEKKLENIKKIKELINKRNYEKKGKITITLQVAFLKTNLPYLEELICFAIDNKLDRVKGHQLSITSEEVRKESLVETKEARKKWNDFIDLIDKKAYRKKIRLENFEKLSIEDKTKNEEINLELKCPFLGKELWINHKGDFNVCCAPDKTRKDLGNFGNIKNRTILNTFNSDIYKDLCISYQTRATCKTCVLRK